MAAAAEIDYSALQRPLHEHDAEEEGSDDEDEQLIHRGRLH